MFYFTNQPFSFSRQRRRWLVSCLPATLACTQLVQAQITNTLNYRMIVPFEPGGITDTLGRAVASGLKQQMNRPWIVENVSGAGGAVGAMRVAQSKFPDEYILNGGAGTFRNYGNSGNPSVAFDPLKELQAVAVIGEMPILSVALAKHETKDLRAHLQQLKLSKQPFVYGSAGVGTSSHVMGALLAMRYGIESLFVPYKGSAPTLRGLMSGEIPVAFIDPLSAASLLQSGHIKCLGMSSPSRHPMLRMFPTYEALGLAENNAVWAGFFVSSKIQEPDYRRWVEHMQRLTKSGFLDETMRAGFIQPLSLFGETAQKYVTQDVNRFQETSKALKIHIF